MSGFTAVAAEGACERAVAGAATATAESRAIVVVIATAETFFIEMS
jgi:hypothetical protein